MDISKVFLLYTFVQTSKLFIESGESWELYGLWVTSMFYNIWVWF